jgi:hypothetical protein
LQPLLMELQKMIALNDGIAAKNILMRIVPEYCPCPS